MRPDVGRGCGVAELPVGGVVNLKLVPIEDIRVGDRIVSEVTLPVWYCEVLVIHATSLVLRWADGLETMHPTTPGCSYMVARLEATDE